MTSREAGAVEARATIKALEDTAQALYERPGDDDAAEVLLTLPLDRGAFQNLGQDLEDRLVQATPWITRGMEIVNKESLTLDWWRAAIKPYERTIATTAEDSPARIHATSWLCTALVCLAKATLNTRSDDASALEEAAGYLDRALALAEDLARKHPKETSALASTAHMIAVWHALAGQPEDARPFHERAASLNRSLIETEGTRSPRGVDRRVALIACLDALGEHEEAQSVFDRAFAGSKDAPRGAFDVRAFVSLANSLAHRHGENNDLAAAIAWSDRARFSLERLARPKQRDIMASIQWTFASAAFRLALAENAGPQAAALGEPSPPTREADLDIALELGRLLMKRAEDAAAVPAEGFGILVAGAWLVGDIHFFLAQHREALEAYEQADAIMARLGVSRADVPANGWLNLSQRGHCLAALGRHAEAAAWRERALEGPEV